MPQETNLNVAPYFDDFNADDQYYKILFKPGFPVQARELTGVQSILQNQIEKFGSHVFKEGSSVTGGGIKFSNAYDSIKLDGLLVSSGSIAFKVTFILNLSAPGAV